MYTHDQFLLLSSLIIIINVKRGLEEGKEKEGANDFHLNVKEFQERLTDSISIGILEYQRYLM